MSINTSKMELMDWKNIETNAENTIHDADVQTRIAKILYSAACKEIWLLGGKTNKEINKEHERAQEEKEIEERKQKKLNTRI